jgi:D-arabinose 1-dehydrogenase-like Zn-dependent alcohol dehydrogenase
VIIIKTKQLTNSLEFSIIIYPTHASFIISARSVMEFITINRLQQLPERNSTAIIIAYDDSGGWYDHVMSPIISQSDDPRNSGPREGDVVAIFGVGGLGHLGIQFASKMGFRTIAIWRGKDKEEIVRKLGAIQYNDSRSQNPVEELVKLGGAKIILGTGPGGKALSSVLGGLAVNGKLIIIGASDEPLELSPNFFFFGHRSVVGWLAGSSIDSEDTLSFSVSSGVRSMNQVFPLESAAEAFDLMMNGKARFRAVLTTGN